MTNTEKETLDSKHFSHEVKLNCHRPNIDFTKGLIDAQLL